MRAHRRPQLTPINFLESYDFSELYNESRVIYNHQAMPGLKTIVNYHFFFVCFASCACLSTLLFSLFIPERRSRSRRGGTPGLSSKPLLESVLYFYRSGQPDLPPSVSRRAYNLFYSCPIFSNLGTDPIRSSPQPGSSTSSTINVHRRRQTRMYQSPLFPNEIDKKRKKKERTRLFCLWVGLPLRFSLNPPRPFLSLLIQRIIQLYLLLLLIPFFRRNIKGTGQQGCVQKWPENFPFDYGMVLYFGGGRGDVGLGLDDVFLSGALSRVFGYHGCDRMGGGVDVLRSEV